VGISASHRVCKGPGIDSLRLEIQGERVDVDECAHLPGSIPVNESQLFRRRTTPRTFNPRNAES
jgi:hypothetical protein